MEKSKLRKTFDVLNTPIYLSEIVRSISQNIKGALDLNSLNYSNKLDINQSLISDEELGLPTNGAFSPKFSELLKGVMNNKL